MYPNEIEPRFLPFWDELLGKRGFVGGSVPALQRLLPSRLLLSPANLPSPRRRRILVAHHRRYVSDTAWGRSSMAGLIDSPSCQTNLWGFVAQPPRNNGDAVKRGHKLGLSYPEDDEVCRTNERQVEL